MHAATINQLSSTIRLGQFSHQEVPIILGNEGSGVIEERDKFAAGARVAIYGASVLLASRRTVYTSSGLWWITSA